MLYIMGRAKYHVKLGIMGTCNLLPLYQHLAESQLLCLSQVHNLTDRVLHLQQANTLLSSSGILASNLGLFIMYFLYNSTTFTG
jgi:hypothetical protein